MTMTITAKNTNHRLTFEDLRGLRAEGYIRDSTLDQRAGFGPAIQRHNEENFANNYGLILGTRWYTEFVSGRSASKRLEFQQVLEDARLDRFDVILVDHTSRFGRDQAECIQYKQKLKDLGKTVIFVSQGIISGSDRDFLSERINETLDEQYSRNLSRYVREGKARKADAGHALGHAPLGFRQEKAKSGRGAWALPDEKTMPTLLAILEGYASGKHSFRTLALELNAQGLRSKRGRPFTVGSVVATLKNPFYIGKFLLHKGKADEELRNGVHEVPEAVKTLWEKCQEVKREKNLSPQPSPRSKHHRIYPLTGILVCDKCGEPFHGVSTVSKPRSYPRMFHSWHRCDTRPLSVAAPKVEQEFSERVLSHIRLDYGWESAISNAVANEGPVPDHSLEIRRIEEAKVNLRKQHKWGAITDADFKSEFQELTEQLGTLVRPVSASPTPDLEKAAKLLTDMPSLWQHPGVTADERRELARTVFQEIRLSEGQLVSIRPRPEYAPLFAYSIWRHNVVGGDTPS